MIVPCVEVSGSSRASGVWRDYFQSYRCHYALHDIYQGLGIVDRFPLSEPSRHFGLGLEGVKLFLSSKSKDVVLSRAIARAPLCCLQRYGDPGGLY